MGVAIADCGIRIADFKSALVSGVAICDLHFSFCNLRWLAPLRAGRLQSENCKMKIEN